MNRFIFQITFFVLASLCISKNVFTDFMPIKKGNSWVYLKNSYVSSGGTLLQKRIDEISIITIQVSNIKSNMDTTIISLKIHENIKSIRTRFMSNDSIIYPNKIVKHQQTYMLYNNKCYKLNKNNWIVCNHACFFNLDISNSDCIFQYSSTLDYSFLIGTLSYNLSSNLIKLFQDSLFSYSYQGGLYHPANSYVNKLLYYQNIGLIDYNISNSSGHTGYRQSASIAFNLISFNEMVINDSLSDLNLISINKPTNFEKSMPSVGSLLKLEDNLLNNEIQLFNALGKQLNSIRNLKTGIYIVKKGHLVQYIIHTKHP